MAVLETLKMPPGDGFVWIAAEAKSLARQRSMQSITCTIQGSGLGDR